MASAALHKRKHCDFTEDTITVLVGPMNQAFTIHPTILTNNSKFFAAVLSPSGSWKESLDRKVQLPEAEINVFQMYTAYVYTGGIETVELHQIGDSDLSPVVNNYFDKLVKLYSLAMYLEDETLRNRIIDKILDTQSTTGYGPGATAVSLAFNSVPENCKLCLLLLNTYLAGTEPKCLAEDYGIFPAGFIKSLTLGWAASAWDKSITYQTVGAGQRCDYHEHDDDNPVTPDCRADEEPKKPAAKKKK